MLDGCSRSRKRSSSSCLTTATSDHDDRCIDDQRRDRRQLLIAALVAIVVLVGIGVVVATTLTPTPRPTLSPRPTAAPSAAPAITHPHDVLLGRGLWLPAATLLEDQRLDGIYATPDQEPGYFAEHIDIIRAAASIANPGQSDVDEAFNTTVFDCDAVVDGVRTVCASGAPIEPGPLLVATVNLAAPAPDEPTEGLLIYALVLDSDDDPANDFEPVAPFTDDFFQGTDRWYQLVYTPDTDWYLSIQNADRSVPTSTARVAIWDDTLVFFVPMRELGTDAPRYRVTAYASTDATFEPGTSGGDVLPGPPGEEWLLAEPTVGDDS